MSHKQIETQGDRITDGYVDENSHMYTVRQRNAAREEIERLLRERDGYYQRCLERDRIIKELRDERDEAREQVASLKELLHQWNDAEHDALEAQVAELKAALGEVEWVWNSYTTFEQCPWCGGIKKHGHASGCIRQKALALP